MVSKVLVIGGSVCALIAFMCAIFIPLSFSYVEPNTVGIRFDSFSKSVDTERTYGAGRYYLGLSTSFYTFPLTLQTLDEKLTGRTRDGYLLTLHVSFQYKLIEEEVRTLFADVKEKYEPIFRRAAREALMLALGRYVARAFFSDRAALVQSMFDEVKTALRPNHAECWGLQFTDISLPNEYDSELLRTQLQNWYVKTKQAEQEISSMETKTEVLRAEFDKEVSIVTSQSQADYDLTLREASSQAVLIRKSADANASVVTTAANAFATQVLRQAQAEADELLSGANANASLLVIQAQAAATVLRGNAEALGSEAKRSMEGLALQYLKDKVGLTADGIVKYQKMMNLGKYKEASVLFGFGNAYAIADASSKSSKAASELQLQLQRRMEASGASGARRTDATDVAARTVNALASLPKQQTVGSAVGVGGTVGDAPEL